MNNQMPFFYPFNNFQPPNNDIYEKLENKIERLEKNLRILENRINKLERNNLKNQNDYLNEEATDMYMI